MTVAVGLASASEGDANLDKGTIKTLARCCWFQYKTSMAMRESSAISTLAECRSPPAGHATTAAASPEAPTPSMILRRSLFLNRHQVHYGRGGGADAGQAGEEGRGWGGVGAPTPIS